MRFKIFFYYVGFCDWMDDDKDGMFLPQSLIRKEYIYTYVDMQTPKNQIQVIKI